MSKVVALVLSKYENYGEYANLPVYNAHGDLVGWTGGELPESGHVCEHAVLDGEGFPSCHSSSEIVKLRAENAKLRELAERAWKSAERLCQAFDGPCRDDGVTIYKPCPMGERDEECIYGQLKRDLRELGIEVDG